MTAITCSTTKLPPAFVGVAYEASFATSVADGVITLSAGTTQTGKDALPDSLAYADARITGTPVAGDEGVYALSIKLDNSGSDTDLDNQAFTLHIYGPPQTAPQRAAETVAQQLVQLALA